MRRTAFLTLAAVLTLTGCSTATTAEPPTDAGTVSDACAAAIEAMANAPDNISMEDWTQLNRTAGTDCATVDEFLAAAHENPDAVWQGSGPLNEDIVINATCLLDDTTPMCQDAETLGLIQ